MMEEPDTGGTRESPDTEGELICIIYICSTRIQWVFVERQPSLSFMNPESNRFVARVVTSTGRGICEIG